MNSFTPENVKPWLLRILGDYEGKFGLEDQVFGSEAVVVRGERGTFVVSREAWDDDRAALERALREWASLAF
jgi:hypothetical protein